MKKELPPFELSLILAHILKKSREYVLAHPEVHPMEYSAAPSRQGRIFHGVKLTNLQQKKYRSLVARRLKNEPMAYILGEKGFYGLDFKVNRHTLIPRPETEYIVELVTQNINPGGNYTVIDVGTGSGNIITSIAYSIKHIAYNKISFYGVDINNEALKIAKTNAKKYKLGKKIKFIKSDLLTKFIRDTKYEIQNTNLIIVANLPYLSKKIYDSAPADVKNYEPKTALYGGKDGLDYYRKLFNQIKLLKKNCHMLRVSCYMEFSPEQKNLLAGLIKKYFPISQSQFKKDLAGKWRIASFKI